MLKLVAIGDAESGKTTCLKCTDPVFHSFPTTEYIPTVLDRYTHDHSTLDTSIDLWDTAGQAAYDQLRPIAYPQTDVFLLCFDISSRDSFENISSKWLPELEHHSLSGVPRVLVGCKSDLRTESEALDKQEDGFISPDEATKFAADRNFIGYIETSSLRKHTVLLLFDRSIEIALSGIYLTKQRKKKEKSCTVM